jgi:hypothetical protein
MTSLDLEMLNAFDLLSYLKFSIQLMMIGFLLMNNKLSKLRPEKLLRKNSAEL